MAAATPGPSAISVPSAFKTLVKILAGMFYSGQCPPPWWVDAADPKKEAPDPEHAMFQQEKKAAQLSREAKRKAQVWTVTTLLVDRVGIISSMLLLLLLLLAACAA